MAFSIIVIGIKISLLLRWPGPAMVVEPSASTSETSASSQHVGTACGLTLNSNTKNKIYEKQFSRHWILGNQGWWPQRDEKQAKVSTMTAPAYALERLSSPAQGGDPGWAQWLPESRTQSYESRKTKPTRVHRTEHQRGEDFTEIELQRSEESSLRIQHIPDWGRHVRKLPKTRERMIWEDERKQCLAALTQNWE